MMTTVFLSGSRKISRLNDGIRVRLKNIIEQGFEVIVGDANGADKALQSFFADMHYDKVVVFCAGNICRNNVGSWPTENVVVDPKLKGRDFYAQKDKAMASKADYGFVLWDGKSIGSITNVFELMKGRKPVVVYFGPEKAFYNLKQAEDVRSLLNHCDAEDYREIDRAVHFQRRLSDLQPAVQTSLNL
jgi:hypothetical protein